MNKNKWIVPKLLSVLAVVFLGNWALKPIFSGCTENLQRILFTMVVPYGVLMPLSFLIMKPMAAVSFGKVRHLSQGRLLKIAIIELGISMPVTGILTVLKMLMGFSGLPDLSMIQSHIFFYGFLLLIFNPIFEELLFRKLMLERLLPLGKQKAILISAAMFALPHLISQGIPQMAGTFVLGLCLSYTVLETGSLRDAVFLHGFYNLYGAFLPVFLTQSETGALIMVLLNFTVIFLGIFLTVRGIQQGRKGKEQNTEEKTKKEA